MDKKVINLGIFGFGTVGQGLFEVLNQTKGISARVKKICIKNPDKDRAIDAEYFTTNRDEILEDPTIDVVVELINDTQAALEIVTKALKNKKAVVSASKKMVAENLKELYDLQQQYHVPLLYEASVCASIPMIRNLEEYYDNDLLHGVEGICNGSSNYILTKVSKDKIDFDTALQQAQEKGYAETDPTSDIEGFDSKYKTCILLLHAFGLFVKPEDVFNFGISRLNDFDIQYAKQQDCQIKLLSICRRENDKVITYVLPKLVSENQMLADITDEYNGVRVESAFAENQFFIGKGAGGTATGSAVLSDISALTYNYHYEYKKIAQSSSVSLSDHSVLRVYVRYQNKDHINLADFENIEVKYESPENRYIIGEINLAVLKEADWFKKNEDVNLMVY